MTLNASNCKKNILVITKLLILLKILMNTLPPSPKYQQVNRKDVMQNAILLKNLLKKPKNYLCQTFDRQTAF